MLRYSFIAQHIGGKAVLDAACGTGFGSVHLLRSGAKAVTGVDVCAKTIEQCQKVYQDHCSDLKFECAALEHLDRLQLEPFDCVVSFETLEHVQDPWRCLDLLAGLVKPNGMLMISVPGETDKHEHNEFHLHHYERDELLTWLKKRFSHVLCYVQKFNVASVLQRYQAKQTDPINQSQVPLTTIALTGEPMEADTYVFAASNGPLAFDAVPQLGVSRKAWLNLARERTSLYRTVDAFNLELKRLHKNFKIEFAKNSDLIKKFTNVLAWGRHHYELAKGKEPEQSYLDEIAQAQSEREKTLQVRIVELEEELEQLRNHTKPPTL